MFGGQAGVPGNGGEMRAVADAEFRGDVLSEPFDGGLGAVQCGGDAFAGEPLAHEGEHLELTRGQHAETSEIGVGRVLYTEALGRWDCERSGP